MRSIDVMFDGIRRHRDLRHILRRLGQRAKYGQIDIRVPDAPIAGLMPGSRKAAFRFVSVRRLSGAALMLGPILAAVIPVLATAGLGFAWVRWLAIRERDVHAAGYGYRNAMPDLRHVRQDHHRAGTVRDDRARFDDGDCLFRLGGRDRSAAGRASTADLSPLAELPEQRKPGVAAGRLCLRGKQGWATRSSSMPSA